MPKLPCHRNEVAVEHREFFASMLECLGHLDGLACSLLRTVWWWGKRGNAKRTAFGVGQSEVETPTSACDLPSLPLRMVRHTTGGHLFGYYKCFQNRNLRSFDKLPKIDSKKDANLRRPLSREQGHLSTRHHTFGTTILFVWFGFSLNTLISCS